MIKLLTIVLAFLSLNQAFSIEEDKFLENCHAAYDEYKIVTNEETSCGDITIVFGIKDNKYYMSAFFLNDSSVSLNLQYFINDKLKSTFVLEGTVVNSYGVRVEENDKVTVAIHHTSQDIKYDFEVNDLINMELIKGTGSEDFPNNNYEKDVIKIIRLFILFFILLSIVLIGIILYFYKMRKGKFNLVQKPVIDVENEYYEEYGDPIEESKESVQQVNKQALMDRYFEEYRKGDITEDELNEKLKRLWWQDDKK